MRRDARKANTVRSGESFASRFYTRKFYTSLAILAFAASIAAPATALAADPMIGYWRAANGLTASVARCGSALCITLRNLEYAGRTIGRMKRTGASYTGTVLHPGWNWTFNGYAKLSGNTVQVSGCVIGRIFCRSQTWK